MEKGKLFTDQETLEHFAKVSNINLQAYPNSFVVKVFEGAEIVIYHYNENKLPVMNTVMLCTGLTVDDRGTKISLMDRRTSRFFKVHAVPKPIGNLDIIAYAPYSFYFKHKLKQNKMGTIVTAVEGVVAMMSRSSPKQRKSHHLQAIALPHIERVFSSEESEHLLDTVQELT